MKVVIDIPEIMYLSIKEYDLKPDPVTTDILYRHVKCGTLLDEANRPSFPPKKKETVTEFADRCRECGSMLGRQMKQQKTGQWIKVETDHSVYYKCSKCDCLAPCTEVSDSFIWKLSAYCPDCGAKMENVGTVIEPNERR